MNAHTFDADNTVTNCHKIKGKKYRYGMQQKTKIQDIWVTKQTKQNSPQNQDLQRHRVEPSSWETMARSESPKRKQMSQEIPQG
jgi:hypothetical protein